MLTERQLLAGAVVFGIVCRLRQYAANTSLWHDESFVALNVLHIPFTGLLGPLDWHEPSPPGFLALEQLMVAVFGSTEPVLRAVPLLAGVAGLIAFAWLAARVCVRERGAVWAVILCAASAKLVADAALVKHFTLDLLIAVGLIASACRVDAARERRAARLLVWGGLGALGLWCSYASAFVFAGTGLVLLRSAVMRWSRTERLAYLGGLLLGLVSAIGLLGAIRAQRSETVVRFWGRAFPDLDGPVSFALWLARAVIGLFDHFWQPLGGVLLVLACLAASVYWHSDRRALFAMLWLPVGGALIASMLRWWPFGGNQHMVFALPAVFLLAGDGMEIVRRRLAGRHPRLAACVLALLLAPGVIGAGFHLVVPRRRHEVRPAIAFMQQRSEPTDQVAVFDQATFAYYTGRDLRGAPLEFSPAARVWVITPRSTDGSLQPDVRTLVERLHAERPQLLRFEAYGAAAYCYGHAERQPAQEGRTSSRRQSALKS
jgi:hypothetical protein